jgi:hypothetical protein
MSEAGNKLGSQLETPDECLRTKKKRPYTKPTFQHERVFETMALACGKLHPTQGQCRFNRKNS